LCEANRTADPNQEAKDTVTVEDEVQFNDFLRKSGDKRALLDGITEEIQYPEILFNILQLRCCVLGRIPMCPSSSARHNAIVTAEDGLPGKHNSAGTLVLPRFFVAGASASSMSTGCEQDLAQFLQLCRLEHLHDALVDAGVEQVEDLRRYYHELKELSPEGFRDEMVATLRCKKIELSRLITAIDKLSPRPEVKAR
jgi:hypothetical protein